MMSKKRFCRSESDIFRSLGQWFKGPPGDILLEQEWRYLEQRLSGLFGYYAVQVGCLGIQTQLLQAGNIKSQILVGSGFSATEAAVAIEAAPESLPIASDSVDVVLLPHTLDFSPNPHQVLREAERILIPEGRVVVVGFNPFSMWGIWRLFRRYKGTVPWCGQFLSQRRIHDWLSLLGFKVEESQNLMFLPPVSHSGSMHRMRRLEQIGSRFWPMLGGVYVVQGIKRVSRLTPVQPAWKIRSGVLGGRLVEPTTRATRTSSSD
ncbi:MAG: methyltransferase domain-containing protein [Candidatus Sedimenticola sp. 6PFRAG5]